MRIVRARLREIALPLREPFRISGGTMDVRRSFLVELEAECGTIGIGESAPFEAPFYSEETIATARDVLREVLFPTVVGSDFTGPTDVHDVLEAVAPRSPMARAGIETAWWDLTAAHQGVTLRQLVTNRLTDLGVHARITNRVRCGVALGLQTDADVLAAQVAGAVREGYHRVKIKIDRTWHVEAVRVATRAVRSVATDVPISVDANGAFEPDRDRAVIETLDSMGLTFIEQPFPADHMEAHASLARSARTPICLDETLADEPSGQVMSRQPGNWVWNMKVQRVGGLEPACRLAVMAHDASIPMWVGTMPESGVGAQAALALAAHDLFSLPTDVEPSRRWYLDGTDPIDLAMDDEGTMAVPEVRVPFDPRRFPVVIELGTGR